MQKTSMRAVRTWRVAGGALLAAALTVVALAVAPSTAIAGAWGATVTGTNLDGRDEQFWVGSDGQVYHRWATTPNGPINSAVHSLGGHVTSGIGVGHNQDGRLEIFGRADGGDINHMWQLSGGGWSGWASLGGQVRAYTGVYGTHHNGRIQVRMTDTSGVTRYKWQQSANCCWTSSWTTSHL